MNNIKWIILLFCYTHLSFSSLIPIDTIIKKPIIRNVSLSLDGDYAAAIYTNEKDKQILMTYAIASGKKNYLKLFKKGDIYNYEWASNTHLVFNVSKQKRYYSYMGSVDRDCIKRNSFLFDKWSHPIDGLLNDPDRFLVWKRDHSNYSMLGHINISTGKYKKLGHDIPGTIFYWETDFSGEPRIAYAYTRGNKGNLAIFHLYKGTDSWQPLYNKKELHVHSFTPDDERLYVSACTREWENKSLYIYDIEDNKFTEKVFQDSLFDFEGKIHFFYNPALSNEHISLKGVTYNTDLPQSHWFDNRIDSIQNEIDSKLPNSSNLIIDADQQAREFLIESYSDVKPEEYFHFNAATNTLTLLLKSRPWITPPSMARTKPITFSTRDSQTLHGYLTLPKKGKAPYPTVVLLHGGPWARDYWGFNPEVQVLASRGYAVLQVNYRGSTGFGYYISRKYQYAFDKMHEDVTDATRYIISEGIADTGCIAIMGGSFGGYLAICGVAFEPDLYRCAISIAGVFDWKKHIRSKFAKYNNYAFDFFKSNIGEGDKRAYLKKISPVNAAKNIKVPVLICGGAKDKNVSLWQSVKLIQAMKRADVKIERFFKGGEGHGFQFQKNQIAFYEKVLTFLQENMSK